MKLLSIVCFAVCVGVFVLAWRGGLAFTVVSYTFAFSGRALLLTSIAFLIAGLVAAFAPHP